MITIVIILIVIVFTNFVICIIYISRYRYRSIHTHTCIYIYTHTYIRSYLYILHMYVYIYIYIYYVHVDKAPITFPFSAPNLCRPVIFFRHPRPLAVPRPCRPPALGGTNSGWFEQLPPIFQSKMVCKYIHPNFPDSHTQIYIYIYINK